MPALRLNRLVAQVVAGSAVPDVTGKIKQMSVRPPLDSKNPIKYVGGDKVTFYRENIKKAEFDTIGIKGDLNATSAQLRRHVANGGVIRKPPDAAILCQSADHYEQLRAQFPQKAADLKVGVGGEQGKLNAGDSYGGQVRMSGEGAGSGEQLYIEGLNNLNLCVADRFEIYSPSGAKKPGLLEVSNPRRPCSNWDKKYEALGQGANGVRHFTLRNTLGGWMFRVIEEGAFEEGDTLKLASRKYPKWTLKEIGTKLYGQAGPLPKDWAKWGGTLDELVELSNIDELGMDEWREDVEELRAKAQGDEVRDFATTRSVKEFGSVTAQKEFALFFNKDEPEPGYFANSETFQKSRELQKEQKAKKAAKAAQKTA